MTLATVRAVILARQSFGAGAGRSRKEASCALTTPAQSPKNSTIFRTGNLSYAGILRRFLSVLVLVPGLGPSILSSGSCSADTRACLEWAGRPTELHENPVDRRWGMGVGQAVSPVSERSSPGPAARNDGEDRRIACPTALREGFRRLRVDRRVDAWCISSSMRARLHCCSVPRKI